MRSWAALCSLFLLPGCGEAPAEVARPATAAAPRQDGGRTGWCETCRRDIGEGHQCGRTSLCPAPACRDAARPVEGGPRHRCGRTSYCLTCGTDKGPEHDCLAGTTYCPRCEADVAGEHACGRSRYCPREECRRERILDAPHHCGSTRYCRRCDREVPLRHRDAGFPGKH